MKIFISSEKTYFINKYVVTAFFVICYLILLFSIIFMTVEYKLIFIGTLVLMFLLSYWSAIRKFLWLKKLYIEQEKLIAEDRGKKINIRIENIDKISRNYFFYHAGLYCIKLRQKSDFTLNY